MSKSRAAFFKLARDRFQQAQTAEKDQRKREQDDLRFYAGDQWPDDIRSARAGQQASNGLPAVPARPMLTINKTREPVRQVLNQERQSDMGIEIVPADDFGELVGPIDETEIQLREGLTRRIQRDSKASDARTWAFARSTICGRGFYAVMTRYVPGKTNDQEVYVHRFYNQSSVTMDPAHEQPDGSDAEWVLVGTDYTHSAYIAEFGERKGRPNRVVDATDDDWRALGDEAPGWFTTVTSDDGKHATRMYRVVDYWYTERTSRELVTYQDASGQQQTEWADEVTEAPEGMAEVPDSRRKVIDKAIKWAKLDGCDDDVLDETDWLGPDMPIVKVLGEELQPYDNDRRTEGMVRPMREPGQGFNYMASRLVETIGLSPLTPVMVEEGTIEGYEEWWQQANTRTLPYLPYKTTNLLGQPAAPPSVPPARNPPIQAVSEALAMFGEAIQDTSGYHGPSLGKVDPSIKSGRAIKALQEQASQGSNHYLDNLQRSIRYEGQIINNLLYPIYGRPGRIARIINSQGDAETILLHQPMVMQAGKPMPAPADHPGAKTYKLTKDAQFNVIVKVSKNFDSKREHEVAILGDLMAQNPELMTWFGDLYFQNMDGPGHQQMADRAKVMLAPPIQQMQQAKAQGQDPQAAAALAQKDQTIQQLQQQLQEASAPGAVEKVKQAGAAHLKELDLDFQAQKAAADNETKLAVAELGAKVDRLALFLEERARLGVQEDAAHQRAHEAGMAAMSQGGAADAQQADQQHAAAMQTDAQQASAEAAEQAAQQQQEAGV